MRQTWFARRQRPVVLLLSLLGLPLTPGSRAQAGQATAPLVVVVLGAAGAPEYGERP